MQFAGRISVFGGRDIDDATYQEVVELGRRFAMENFLVFCGGANGVMEALAKGMAEKEGVCIGIIKDIDFGRANPYVTIPIATNMGIGRNPLLAYNCDVAVAINGRYGTLSEIAYALQLDKPVIGYKTWEIEGITKAQTLDEIVPMIHILLD